MMASKEAKIQLYEMEEDETMEEGFDENGGLTVLLICHASHTAGRLTDRFILVNHEVFDGENLYQVSMDGWLVFGINLWNSLGYLGIPSWSAIGLKYNYDMNYTYMTTSKDREAAVISLDGRQLKLLATPTNASIRGLAYDPTSRLLFYAASAVQREDLEKGHYGFVGVFDMKDRELTLRKSPWRPKVITVHPPKGLVFYITDGSRHGLYRIEMNGAKWTSLITNNIVHARAVTIDYDVSILYFCDESRHTYSCDFDGGNRRTVFMDRQYLALGMILIDGYLYYCAYNRPVIFKLKTDNISDLSVVIEDRRLHSMTAFDIYIKGVTDNIVPKHPECSVNNQNCSHFCLPITGGYVCACETGYSLLSDMKHCENVPRCPIIMKSAVVNDTDPCLRLPGNVCKFECLKAYKRKASNIISVTCTNEPEGYDTNILLWNMEPCQEIFCPDSIENGVLSETCNTSYLSVCNYTCNEGYRPNKHLLMVTCVREGEWGKEGLFNATTCIAECPSFSADDFQATLDPNCTRDIGVTCNITCDSFFKNMVPHGLKCLPGYQWHVPLDTICKGVYCPNFIENGVLNESCDVRYTSTCDYTCNYRFRSHRDLPNVTCLGNGEWGKEGHNLTVCTECVHAVEPLIPTFGECQPYILEGIVRGGCQNCDGYHVVTYEWMLREHFCSENTTILKGIDNTVELICNSLNCDNLRNGMTSERLTFIVTVTAQNDLPNSKPVKSSLYTEVFVRKLPVEEEELQCTISPKVGGKAIETKYHINCTALHLKYDLYSENDSNFYKDHTVQFMKKIFVESDSEVLLLVEFVEPVSQGFALPAGDPVILKVKVYNCDKLVLSQITPLKVLTYNLDILSIAQWRTYVTSDVRSVMYSTASLIRNLQKMRQNDSDYADLKMEMLLQLTRRNETSLQGVTTTTAVLNIITENVNWLRNISAKTGVVNLYSKLSGYFGEYMGPVLQDELMYTTGIVVKGVSSLLDYFVDEKGRENQSDAYSKEMLSMSKQLMLSLDEACDIALRNLQQTDSPVFLYASETTALLVQKQNSSGISGTTLLLESGDPYVSDTSFEFPDNMGFDKDSEINIQMIYQEKNPYMWKNTPVQVTSPVLTINIKDEDGYELEIDNLSDPVKYVTPRTSNLFDIGQINITYMRTNESFSFTDTSQMLMVNITIHERETKIFELLLPENIGDIWVYGQPLQPPDYLTVLRKGFNYPRDWKAMQDFYSNVCDPNSLPSRTSDFKICITADEQFFSINRSSYEMYFGITINFKDMMNQLEELDTKCKNVFEECIGDLQLSFSIQMDSLYCLYWNETLSDWSTDGCEVFRTSNVKQLECRCYHLSSFSVSHISRDFLVEPVLVTFDDVTLFLTFFDNPVVVTAVAAVWLVYFSLVFWARRLDKKDMEQIGVLNCDDDCPSEEYLYVVCVMTGWWNQAGTTANVFMNISGVTGSTSKKKLSTNARQCFQSGFEDWFVFTTERGLGSIESVTIWHDNSGKSPHWYLTQVYVKDLQTGASWNFIYNDWLAVDRGDLRHTSATIPATSDEDMKVKQKYNFFITSSRNLRESHLWISIFSKTPRSSFSRVQRLTCSLSLLLTMMLTNIMFYGLPTDGPEEQIQAGSFSFSLRQFIIGMESSIIMFPVNFIIVQLFMRVKLKPGKEKKIKIDSEGKQRSGPSYESKQSEFYIILYRSKRFLKSKLYQEICSIFPAEVKDKNGPIIVEKYVEACAKNIIWKSLKVRERKGSSYNLTKGLSQEEFFHRLKQSRTRTVSLTQKSSEQSSLTYLSEKLGSSLGDEAIEINVSMSKCCTQRQQRNNDKDWSSASSFSSNQRTELKSVLNRKGVKKVFPWWFIYISWSIVMLTCLVSSFFIMLYGLKYGYTRSIEWIVSFFTGVFQGICVEQPLKVIGISFILTLILQRPAEIEEYGPDMELATDEEYVNEIKIEDYKHQPFVEPISDSLLKRIRQRLRLEWFMDRTIRDIVLYILYLTVLLIMVHGHSNNYISYQNSQTVYNLMVRPKYSPTLLEVTTPEAFYTYMLETFVPVAQRLSDTHSDVVTSTSNHYVLGFFRLRQVRVKSGECETVLPHNFVVRCVDDYWMGSEDTESYAGNWSNIATIYPGTGPWTYYDSWDLKTLPFAGTHATYSGGGYVQIMKNNAAGKIQDLDNKGWIDEHTRAVFVECTIYSPSVDVFTSVILLFEITPLGHMYPKHEILSTNLHHYNTDFQKVVAACEILFVCFNIFFIHIEYQKLKRNGKGRYFSETWTYVELLQTLLSIVTIGLFTKRFITVSNTLKDHAENHKTKYISFSEAFLWNSILEYVMAFLVAIAIMKATKLLNFVENMKLVTETLAKVRPELFGFLFLFSILIMAYSHSGCLFFGRVMHVYRNVEHSFYSNTLIIFGTEIGQELKNTSSDFGPVFMISFVVAVNYILVQLLVSILNTGRIITKFELSKKRKNELLNYVATKIRMIAARK